MGNSASADAHEHDEDPFNGADTLGYRVLGVQPNSPASKAGLVSFLDFLVGANGTMLLGSGENLEEGEEYDDVDLPALLQSHVNQEIEFCKCRRYGTNHKPLAVPLYLCTYRHHNHTPLTLYRNIYIYISIRTSFM